MTLKLLKYNLKNLLNIGDFFCFSDGFTNHLLCRANYIEPREMRLLRTTNRIYLFIHKHSARFLYFH